MPPVRPNVRMIDATDVSAPASDEALVSAIRHERSEAAFAVLYDRHTPRAFQTAWRIVGGNPHEAEDVVQEAWLRAVSSLDRWSRQYLTHLDVVDVVEAELRTADFDLEPVDRDELYSKYEAVPPEWMQIEH